MTPFDRLHPALQHHIVNSLGWRALRPIQEEAIAPLLAGAHALVIGPTAGGKTEAVVFPLLSRMLGEGWQGLSLLYVCPIKALLNNLEPRLATYAGLIGRRVERWHGDIGDSMRRRIRQDPPDILLTTPESIEVMLVSRRSDPLALFGRAQAVIVDELHAFAGDDRGWHLLAVLERVMRIAGRELQRVGLSATIGNPEELLTWLSGPCPGKRCVIGPPADVPTLPEVGLDHVGATGPKSLDCAGCVLVASSSRRGRSRGGRGTVPTRVSVRSVSGDLPAGSPGAIVVARSRDAGTASPFSR